MIGLMHDMADHQFHALDFSNKLHGSVIRAMLSSYGLLVCSMRD